MFEFAYPQFFLLLVPVALWVFFTLRKLPVAMTFSAASILGRLAGKGTQARARIPLFLRTAALVFLVLAICRPQTVNVARDVKTPGVDIILCLDTSGSMQAMDFKLDNKPVDRLTAVKKVVRDFIKKREHDRIGLVVFGTHAFTQAPLTQDKGLLLTLMDKLEIGMAGRATAIGDALAIAGKRIKDIPAKSKIVILLSDGSNTAGEMAAPDAAAALAALGIKIYTIGVGTDGPVPVKVQNSFGAKIEYVNSPDFKMDEKLLAEVAEIGQGVFYHAASTKKLAAIYDEIDKAEKTDVKSKEFFHFDEHYQWFLGFALLAVLFEVAGLFRRAVP